MGLLDKIFNRKNEDSGPDLAVTLNEEARRGQLRDLEQACQRLVDAMRAKEHLLDTPGWRQRINEYNQAAGNAMMLSKATLDRERLLDLAFEIRPVFSGTPTPGLEDLGPLQDDVMRYTEQLREFMPGERAGA